MLSGRGLCDELITRPEEFYRLLCVIVCALETKRMRKAITSVGPQRQRKKKKNKYPCHNLYALLGPADGNMLYLYVPISRMNSNIEGVVVRVIQSE